HRIPPALTAAVPPAQPAVGPGGSAYEHGGMTATSGGKGDEAWYVFAPAAPAVQRAPVTVIAHGYGEYAGYAQMEALIRHTVRHGGIVVYPRWQTCLLCPAPNMRDPLAAAAGGVRGALAWLRADAARPQPLADEASYFGFSYGGMITLNLANRWAALGLPRPRAVMLDEPTGGPVGDQFDASMAGVPASAKLVCMVSVEYARSDPGHGCYHVWDSLGRIAARDKDFVLVHTDAHGTPALHAVHGMSTGDAVDAIDYFAVWKLWDAARACALTGTWCDYLDGTAQEQSMGSWSDGTPVTALSVADRPVTA
uniref:hypothetical protein n=1 Tax=Actinomadura fibrosa TaxID=111802 RepID=UPI0013F1619C